MAQKFGIKTGTITAPFDEGLRYLMNEGCRIISLEDAARLRVENGINSEFCKKILIVREGFVRVPGVGDFLTKKSPIIMRAKQAAGCHGKEEEFYLRDYLSEEQINRILDERNGNAIRILDEKIPTDEFEDNRLTRFAFGKFARDYGDFLRKNGIHEITLFVPEQNYVQNYEAFARQVILMKIENGYDSAIDCDRKELHLSVRIFGVVSDD